MACHVSPDTRFLEIREILTISEFNWAARFRETIPMVQPFYHPRSRKIPTFLWTIPVNYSFAPFLSEKFKFKIFTGFTKTLHSLYGFEPILVWSYEIGNYNIEKFYLRSLDFKRDRL